MTELAIRDLTVRLPDTARGVLENVELTVSAGEIVGLVGESGSGKSTTANAAIGLLPDRAEVSGMIHVGDVDLLSASKPAIRKVRTHDVGMIYQNPSAALNPVATVGSYGIAQLQLGLGYSARDARNRLSELFTSVGLRNPDQLLRSYPHQLSGGMLQRVVIASALATDPELLLADEATSALDVTTQAEIVSILLRLKRERGLGILFITHDLALAAAMCDRVCVVYAGRLVEAGTAEQVFSSPRHPYTAGLRDSTPELGVDRPIRPISGRPPSLTTAVEGCPFASRCPHAEPECTTLVPELEVEGDRLVACRRSSELNLSISPSPALLDGGK